MKLNVFIKIVTLSLFFQLFAFTALGQQNDSTTVAEEKPKKDNSPVRNTFESSYFLNNQTINIPTLHTIEFIIQHRFGKLNSEDFDLLGLYAPSNIRMGLNYAITRKFQLGIGTTKNNKLQDLNWKYAILKQTISGSMPVSITYYGNVAIDVRKDVFPKMTNRLSYFSQLMIARKFNNKISFQMAASYSYFNMVDPFVKRGNLGLSTIGRYKFNDVIAVLCEYDYNFTKQDKNVLIVKPNLSLGIETSTGSHVFQIFVGTNESIISQHNFLYNSNDFTKKDVVIGFNITRLFDH